MATSNASEFDSKHPVMTVDTAGLGLIPTHEPAPKPDDLYPSGIPEPTGTDPAEKLRALQGANTDPTSGQGVEGEVDVWQAHYSQLNFVGRALVRGVISLIWACLAIYTWGMNHLNWNVAAWIGLAIVAVLWLSLGFRMLQARYSHFYRLTNRRLFVSVGIVSRRRDMMELLRVEDVFTRQQSLMERWLNVGTVVVVPSEKSLPTFYLPGVESPKQVMDLVWHHARAERDQRSLKVEDI